MLTQRDTACLFCTCVTGKSTLFGATPRRTRAPKAPTHREKSAAIAQLGTYDLRSTPKSGSHRASSDLGRILLPDVNVVCYSQDIAPELFALGKYIKYHWTEVPRLNWWWKVRLSIEDPYLSKEGKGPLSLAANAVGCAIGDQNGLGESKGLAQQLGPANIPILHSKFLQLGAARIAQVDQAIAKDVTTLVQQMGTSLQLLNHDAHDLCDP